MAFDKQIFITRLKKISILLFWSSLLVMLFVSLSFVNKQADQITCKQVEVEIDYLSSDPLLNRSMVLKLATGNERDTLLLNRPIETLDLEMLEERLLTSVWVKTAQVFTDLNGRLFIQVTQRTPVLRVINVYNEHFYIDSEGLKMPLSQLHSAHVPVASGYITESLQMGDTIQTHVMKGLLKIATYVDKDAFWKAQIEQIFVNEEAEFVLSPKLGNHVVYFGDTQNMIKKFDNLHVFYREALNRIGWSKYRTIDVRFENQIIAKK